MSEDRRFVVTVTPNPSLDLTYVLSAGDALAADEVEVHRAASATLEASGKGVNVSRALAAVGVPGVAVLPVGGPTGHQLTELLSAESVPYLPVPAPGATRVNTTVLEPGGRTVKVNAPGRRLDPVDIGALLAAAGRALAQAVPQRADEVWLVLCGSLPAGTDPGTPARFVALARENGARCAVDSSGAALAAALAAGADLLAPNRAELAEVAPEVRALLEDPRTDQDRLGAAVAEIAASRRCELLVSLGADGALWTDGDQVVHAAAPPVVPVNTAGAGDALLAGWFAHTGAPAARLAAAVTWGRAACLAPTTVPSRQDLAHHATAAGIPLRTREAVTSGSAGRGPGS